MTCSEVLLDGCGVGDTLSDWRDGIFTELEGEMSVVVTGSECDVRKNDNSRSNCRNNINLYITE